ncbi:hypothetical protein BD626DRAFT_512544 [Schizophyllum amplum]|uniref:Small secreted protein n=1 Tax=Schizophyllum amplum TaxID=97359 RepID=A0A550C0C2_9AGAR|nr:hypothetical protein BD626DRAFT_512544 [Auriculariopsis ampla]
MQPNTIFSAVLLAALAAANPLARNNLYQEVYASDDCSGEILARIDDGAGNCNSLPATAYSLKSYGPSCCGAALYAEANTCTGSSDHRVSAGANDGECISYPNSIKRWTAGCC